MWIVRDAKGDVRGRYGDEGSAWIKYWRLVFESGECAPYSVTFERES